MLLPTSTRRATTGRARSAARGRVPHGRGSAATEGPHVSLWAGTTDEGHAVATSVSTSSRASTSLGCFPLEILQANALAAFERGTSLRDTPGETRVVLESIFEPGVFKFCQRRRFHPGLQRRSRASSG